MSEENQYAPRFRYYHETFPVNPCVLQHAPNQAMLSYKAQGQSKWHAPAESSLLLPNWETEHSIPTLRRVRDK